MSGEGQIIDLFRAAMTTVAMVGAPFIVTALVIGLVMAVIQAATQLQEASLSFVPKIVAVGVVLTLAGPWVLGRLVAYTTQSITTMGQVGRLSGNGR